MESSIIHSNTYTVLIDYLNHLDSEARQSKGFNGLFKVAGLTGLGLGGMTMFTLTGWGALVLAGSGLGYIGSLVAEARKTGKVMPLPFLPVGLDSVARGVAQVGGGNDDSDEIIPYHYLDAHQKSDYALLSVLLPEIATALEALPTDAARRAAWARMSRRFHQAYASAVKDNPDMIALGADKATLAAFVLASADELRQIAMQPMAPALPAVEQPPAIGPATQLTAVDIAAVAVDDPWVSTPAQAMPVEYYAAQVPVIEQPIAATLSAAKTALEQIKQSPYKSRIFFGAQRSGKSMLVAIASKQLADRGVKVYHLNLLSYAKDGLDEDAKYTQHCIKSVRGDISKMSEQEVTWLVTQAIALVNEWWAQDNAILIVDEWAYLAAKDCQFALMIQALVGLIAGKMSALNSSGMKRTLAVWAVAPKMVAGNLTESGKSIKSMECVYVTVRRGQTVDWQGQGVGFDEQLFDQVSNNYAITRPTIADSGSSRIAFVGDRWLPLGTTPDMLAQPLAQPRQLAIPDMPQGAVAVAEPVVKAAPISLFDEPQYPEITALIPKCDEVTTGILKWLVKLGDGAEVTTSIAAVDAWVKTAIRLGKIPNAKAESIAPFLEKLAQPKIGFLKPTGEKAWVVTLR
jgi:hypothetical protein